MFGGGVHGHLGFVFRILCHLQVIQSDRSVFIEYFGTIVLGSRKSFIGNRHLIVGKNHRRYRRCEASRVAGPF